MPEHPLAAMMKLDPSYMDELKKVEEIVYSEGALPRRIKFLMALAFDAAHGATTGVSALARRAMGAGATNQEIAETLRVAAHLGGIGSLYTASEALKGIV